VLLQSVFVNSANPLPAAWRLISEMAYFIGLIGAIGSTMLYLLVLRPVLRRPTVAATDRAVLHRRANLVMAVIGTWFLVALYFQIAGKAARIKGKSIPYGEALLPGKVGAYVNVPAKHGEWISTGHLALIQYALWGLGALLLMLLWSQRLRTHTTGIALAALAATFLAHQVTLLPTDFAKETSFNLVDLLFNHLHVFAVSTWVGGIGTLIALVTARRGLSARGGVAWAQIWTRFSTLALTAVGTILISGLFLAWTFVGRPGELFTTSFGAFLLIKVSLVATMILIGGANEFWLMPRIARARAEGADASVFRLAVKVFPGLVGAEVALGVCVIFVLTFLSGSARDQAGDPDPTISGGIVGIGVLLIVLVAVAFVTTAKVSDRLSRPPAAELSPVAGEAG
jgi:copper transport protein